MVAALPGTGAGSVACCPAARWDFGEGAAQAARLRRFNRSGTKPRPRRAVFQAVGRLLHARMLALRHGEVPVGWQRRHRATKCPERYRKPRSKPQVSRSWNASKYLATIGISTCMSPHVYMISSSRMDRSCPYDAGRNRALRRLVGFAHGDPPGVFINDRKHPLPMCYRVRLQRQGTSGNLALCADLPPEDTKKAGTFSSSEQCYTEINRLNGQLKLFGTHR